MERSARARSRWMRSAFIAVLVLVSAGCATTGINRGQINIITSAEEVTMGQELAAEVGKQYAIYNNATVIAYVRGVGNRIVQHCDRRDIEYHFAVIDKDELNAFAMPGGYVYVYTGLMKGVNDEAQLAAVIAHEVGHVAARHATERLTAVYGYQFVASLVLGENPNSYAKLVSEMLSTGGFLAYSRKNEYEADQLAVKYLHAAGYDPRGMVDLMAILEGTGSSEPSRLEELLATHPPTLERLSRVTTEVNALSKLANPTRDASGYARIKAQLPK